MIIKQCSLSHLFSHAAGVGQTVISEVSPCTPEERLKRIEMLAQRIAAHVQHMCGPGPRQTSAEAEERALDAFYEGMMTAERELRKIHDAFLLV